MCLAYYNFAPLASLALANSFITSPLIFPEIRYFGYKNIITFHSSQYNPIELCKKFLVTARTSCLILEIRSVLLYKDSEKEKHMSSKK